MKNDSKITRAERTLEKTVQQAEFIAGQIAKNAADGCFVACPECGQLIPTPYSGFISREAADRYALDHCDCQQVKTRITAACSDEIMPADQMTYIMLQRAPQDRWEPPQKITGTAFWGVSLLRTSPKRIWMRGRRSGGGIRHSPLQMFRSRRLPRRNQSRKSPGNRAGRGS